MLVQLLNSQTPEPRTQDFLRFFIDGELSKVLPLDFLDVNDVCFSGEDVVYDVHPILAQQFIGTTVLAGETTKQEVH